jgi:hypothetical protein
MGDHRTDYRVWAICFAVFFLPPWLFLLGIGLEGRHLRSPLHLFQEGACSTLFLAVVAATFGWFVQSVMVGQGEGLRDREPRPHEEDYGDRPPAP